MIVIRTLMSLNILVHSCSLRTSANVVGVQGERHSPLSRVFVWTMFAPPSTSITQRLMWPPAVLQKLTVLVDTENFSLLWIILLGYVHNSSRLSQLTQRTYDHPALSSQRNTASTSLILRKDPFETLIVKLCSLFMALNVSHVSS